MEEPAKRRTIWMTILSSARGLEISLKFECDGWAVWESILLTARGYSMAISHLCSFFFAVANEKHFLVFSKGRPPLPLSVTRRGLSRLPRGRRNRNLLRLGPGSWHWRHNLKKKRQNVEGRWRPGGFSLIKRKGCGRAEGTGGGWQSHYLAQSPDLWFIFYTSNTKSRTEKTIWGHIFKRNQRKKWFSNKTITIKGSYIRIMGSRACFNGFEQGMLL